MFIMIIIIVSIFISAGLYVLCELFNKPVLKYVFKPLTTILVIFLALLQAGGDYDLYCILIITGLLFSLIGDIYLMLPSDSFVNGLASFLIAHIFFIVSFDLGFGPYLDILYLIPAVIYAIIFLWKILPKTGKLSIPVFIYAVVLLVFLWQATGRFYYLADSSAFYTFIGAILFVISDSILGYSRFIKNSQMSFLFIHITYWGALIFFALSV